jgi:hypothetical protein
MVNLLTDKYKNEFRNLKKTKDFSTSTSQFSDSGNKKIQEKPQKIIQKPINIKQYHDSEGLSVGKMEFGLWFIQNKSSFVKLFYLFLIIISVVTWAIFFFTFGHYIIIGMKQDKSLSSDLVSTATISHELILSQMPKPLLYNYPEIIKQKDLNTQIITEIENPNEKHWAEIDYSYIDNGVIVMSGKTFVLPKENKLLADSTEKQISNEIILKINSIGWKRHGLGDYKAYKTFHDEHLDFTVDGLVFTPSKKTLLSEKIPLNSLGFRIKNNTPYNYWRLPLNIFFYNNSSLTGASEYTIVQFLSGEEKTIDLTIPGSFNRVSDTIIAPNINILDKEVYIDFKAQ